MTKVSIIVPCYNVAPYVAKCLDSLINQTLSDIEIICVDDKSTDDTAKIVADYAKRDKRIKLIKQRKNQGVSVARNTGIDAATGEFIGFVDADDWVDCNYLSKLYKKATKSHSDICVSNVKEHMTNGKIGTHDAYVRRVVKNKRFFSYIQCAAIYKTSFIQDNELYCPVGITNGEDTVFCIKCATLCNKVSSVPNVYYHYMRRDDSAETKIYSEKHVSSRIKVAHAVVDFINKVNISESDYKYYFKTMFNALTCKLFSKTSDVKLRKQAIDAISELYSICKYPNMFRNCDYALFLMCHDKDGLYNWWNNNWTPNKTIKVRIFNKITIVKVKKTFTRTKIVVLGVPVLYINNKV